MKVRLINYSQNSSNDSLLEQIAYCARVSNPSNQNNKETSEKLVRYLIKNKHWSPLEMVSACLEIETTRDIARQMLRHRSFSFQEFSQRYAAVDQDNEFQPRELRIQDKTNRQNSIAMHYSPLTDRWKKMQEEVDRFTKSIYYEALDMGVAKEQARAVLPEGLTASKLYMNGTMRSWVHFVDLRSGNGTQKEHMQVAKACAQALEPIFPMIMEFVQPEVN